jgi:hypothetical protein
MTNLLVEIFAHTIGHLTIAIVMATPARNEIQHEGLGQLRPSASPVS